VIIQTAPPGKHPLAIMMYEHTALAHQFARAFGNDEFEAAEPDDLMFRVVLHHDEGWMRFDRDPVTDPTTDLPYNLVRTPAEHITVTSRLSPDFNERQHPFCGLISSMHSWGLYNGRYGLSDMVLIDTLQQSARPLAEAMLSGELERQTRLKRVLRDDWRVAPRLETHKLFQNYKQLQFFDTLALYFNRTHESERSSLQFNHVPLDCEHDTTIEIRSLGAGRYALSPYPFGADRAEFAYGGRVIAPGQHKDKGWPAVFASAPTAWERFTLVAG